MMKIFQKIFFAMIVVGVLFAGAMGVWWGIVQMSGLDALSGTGSWESASGTIDEIVDIPGMDQQNVAYTFKVGSVYYTGGAVVSKKKSNFKKGGSITVEYNAVAPENNRVAGALGSADTSFKMAGVITLIASIVLPIFIIVTTRRTLRRLSSPTN